MAKFITTAALGAVLFVSAARTATAFRGDYPPLPPVPVPSEPRCDLGPRPGC